MVTPFALNRANMSPTNGRSFAVTVYFPARNLKISSNKINFKQSLKVSIDVSNTGNYDGQEIVQLYIRDLVGSVTRPLKELKNFQKIMIKKGETKTVSFELNVEDLKFYNSDLNFVAEPGEFEVFIGPDSNTKNSIKFDLY